MNILAELRRRFAATLQSFTEDVSLYAAMIQPARDGRFGDFQANCAMPLAKKIDTDPRALAAEIVARLDVAELCLDPEVAGPGFINLRLRDEWLLSKVNGLIRDDRLGIETVAEPRNFVIDYSAPNVAKPMHVGHLRSTAIGDAVYSILSFLGHRVVSDNHIGDWGTQFGMIIFGFKHFVDDSRYDDDAVGELARLYRLVNQLSEYHAAVGAIPDLKRKEAELDAQLTADEAGTDPADKRARKSLKQRRGQLSELRAELASAERKCEAVENDPTLGVQADAHPDIAQQSREETARLHAGDEENRRLWERFLPACLEALERVYDRLQVRFDLALGESFYQPFLGDVVADLEARGLARESDGAVCVFVEGNDAPLIVRKADGAFTYATTDLATIKYRVEEMQADEILYVVDARQSEHFKLLFETARGWGFNGTVLRHVRFGTILGEDGRPFKTRAGDTVGLESLLDESLVRARNIVDQNDDDKKNGPELDEAARADVARAVGIGGIKYADLRHNRESDYVFRWDKMLAKTGDTAAYIQYGYARICGIFRRGGLDRDTLRNAADAIVFTAPEERALGLQLARFAEALDDVVADARPNLLTQYLFETANVFNAFYEKCHVLKEQDEAIRSSRLLLCDLTARVFAQGLSLLGIETCEQM